MVAYYDENSTIIEKWIYRLVFEFIKLYYNNDDWCNQRYTEKG